MSLDIIDTRILIYCDKPRKQSALIHEKVAHALGKRANGVYALADFDEAVAQNIKYEKRLKDGI